MFHVMGLSSSSRPVCIRDQGKREKITVQMSQMIEVEDNRIWIPFRSY